MTTADKELIRLAAKVFFNSEEEATHAIVSLGWNPLNDDGETLRLAMALDISIHLNRDELTVICQSWRPNGLFKKVGGNRKDVDVRRCVVEVAAQIGRGTP